MKRRTFIIASGAVIAAPFISSYTNSSKNDQNSSENDIDARRDNYRKFQQPIMQVLAIAMNAPSAHNTQPFKFKIISDIVAEFYLDKNEALPATDPPLRQLHISCGCFLGIVKIGASIIQHEAEIKYFPLGAYNTDDFGKKPIAIITLSKSTAAEHPLASSIFKRHTSRYQYSGDIIKKELFEEMKAEANIQSSKMIFQNEMSESDPYLKLFIEAMKIESFTVAANEESRRMWRFSTKDLEKYRNGLTWEGQGVEGVKKIFARLVVKNTKESWNKESTIEKGLSNFKRSVLSSRGIVYWVTDNNTPQDWVAVGIDIINFWLVLTKNGYYCHPLNQVIQEYSEMDELRGTLDRMLNIPPGHKIQMIVRIGNSRKPYISYRKHLGDMVNG